MGCVDFCASKPCRSARACPFLTANWSADRRSSSFMTMETVSMMERMSSVLANERLMIETLR
jgi:hypothetical protein